MLGINGPEFIVLAVVALIVVGPERLPQYAAQLGRLVRELRRMASGAKQQVRAELGPDFDDIDWQKLDPRQYDPRRIVREALSDAWEDEQTDKSGARKLPPRPKPSRPASRAASGRADGAVAGTDGADGGLAPFDSEAT